LPDDSVTLFRPGCTVTTMQMKTMGLSNRQFRLLGHSAKCPLMVTRLLI
jgi:hypothetical protein